MNDSTPVESSVLKKAELLANKFDRLNSHFDVVESTIDECTEYVQSLEGEVIKADEGTSIDGAEILVLMRQDFMLARETLTETMKNGREVLTSINAKLTLFDDDSADSELVSAYANVIKATNEGAKLLMGMYSEIVKTHQALEKKDKSGKGGVKVEGDMNVNVVGGNISDIIKQLKG